MIVRTIEFRRTGLRRRWRWFLLDEDFRVVASSRRSWRTFDEVCPEAARIARQLMFGDRRVAYVLPRGSGGTRESLLAGKPA